MPLREKETVSESGDIFLKKGADPFNLSFSYETFSMTSGGSAYRRRQHQYLHPAVVYAPNLQENWGSQPSRAAMDRITPPRTEYPPQKKKMKILGALNDCGICRGSHFNILPMPKPNQTTENEMNNAIKATKTYGLPIPHQGKLQANPSKGCHWYHAEAPPFITNWWIFQAKAPYKESRPHDGGRPI